MEQDVQEIEIAETDSAIEGSQSEPFVSIQNLNMRTPEGCVYKNVYLTAEKGQLIALFGDNGCGKTALLLSIAGRMRCHVGGPCKVAGYDLARKSSSVRRNSALSFFANVNVADDDLKLRSIMGAELRLIGKHAGSKIVLEELDKWGFKDKSKCKFSSLNSFEKARFGIALACISDPLVLVVDDIQSELTQYESRRLIEELQMIAQERQIAVFVAVNDFDLASRTDGIVYLSQGAVEQHQLVLEANPNHKDAPIAGIGNDIDMEGDVA